MDRVAKRKAAGDEGGASGDSVGGVEQYRLHTAAARGVVAVATRLLDGGADIEARESDGQTPLHVACRTGKIKMPTLLLDRGAAIEAKAVHNRTSLHLAAMGGHLNTTKLLIGRKAAVDSIDRGGYAPLHFAQNEGIARALVDAGADVHVRSECGRSGDEFGGDIDGSSTPLHLAVDAGVVEVLIDAGAHVMAMDENGLTPLHRARNAGVVDALIAAGSDTEAEDDEGRTPLECARDVEVARALLDGGADIEHWRVADGDSFADGECDYLFGYVYGTPLVNSVKDEDISILLIERGAGVSAFYIQEGQGEVSAVGRHVQAGNVRVVREMLRKNVVVGREDLMAATKKMTGEILRLMIERVGASVADARDKLGNTPLHRNMFHEVASLLIEKGVDIKAVNHEGETPLHSVCRAVSDREGFAERVHLWEAMFVLVKGGASTDAKRKDGKKPFDLLQIDSGDLLRLMKHSDVHVVKHKA